MLGAHEFNEETERLLLEDSSLVESVHVLNNGFARGSVATRLVAALEVSTHLERIAIHLDRFDDPEEDPSALLQFLQNVSHGKEWKYIAFHGPSTSPGLLSQFLQATKQNQDLRVHVGIWDFPLQAAHLKLLPRWSMIHRCHFANRP